MSRTPFTRTAVVGLGLGLACMVAASAATAPAARSTASPFELVATDRYEAECPDWWTCPGGTYVGTFTSVAPFCESGTVDYVQEIAALVQNASARRYTCGDGSGSLTLVERTSGSVGDWTIVEGSGRYADLSGKGSHSWVQLSEGPPSWVFRTTLRGFADADAVAPSIVITSASASKLRGPPGIPAYRVQVAFLLRDDEEGNPVAYSLEVTQGRVAIATEEGTAASGSGAASVSLRIEPFRKGVRSVGVHIRASDPVGNEQSLSRLLKLPRR